MAMSPPIAFFARNGAMNSRRGAHRLAPRADGARGDVSVLAASGLPYPEAQTLIEDMKDQFGAHRLIWDPKRRTWNSSAPISSR
jgi:hypothetical protein